MQVPFTYIDDVLTIYVNHGFVTLKNDDPRYNSVKKALRKGEQAVLDALNVSIEKYLDNKAKIVDGEILIDDKPIHKSLEKRIKEFMCENLPFQPLINFVRNVRLNPSYQSQLELYDFLEHRGLPITEDGYFLGYKAIRNDWMDKYSGTISNKIGCKPELERSSVDDNRNEHCSKGLHVGSLEYVKGYANFNDKIIIVKVHPQDAVSVPTDCNFTKLRCCKYEVIAEFKEELTRPSYKSNGSALPVENIALSGKKLICTDDDYFSDDDIVPVFDKKLPSKTSKAKRSNKKYGIKPNGQKYYNVRKGGKFVSSKINKPDDWHRWIFPYEDNYVMYINLTNDKCYNDKGQLMNRKAYEFTTRGKLDKTSWKSCAKPNCIKD